MDNTKDAPAILSLCTGLRGLERGIERVIGDIRTVAYVEIEAFIVANLVAQMESGLLAPAPVWTNLKTFPARQFYGKVHIITGGYPCQPFSNAGLRLGEEDPRHLWPFIKQHISAIRPVWCFFENVPGHLSLGYETVKSELEELGYTVKEGIYSAEEVGAPHQRERLFILALADTNRNGYGAGAGTAGNTSKKNENTSQGANREWLRSIIGDCGSNVANSCSQGLERQGDRKIGAGTEFSLLASRGNNEFPAGQGGGQYGWEEPRTTKSGLGCTINGYNFREDLLRGLGNGVVEQTAEIAFRDLLRKHRI